MNLDKILKDLYLSSMDDGTYDIIEFEKAKAQIVKAIPKKFDRKTMVEASKIDCYGMNGYNQAIDDIKRNLGLE